MAGGEKGVASMTAPRRILSQSQFTLAAQGASTGESARRRVRDFNRQSIG